MAKAYNHPADYIQDFLKANRLGQSDLACIIDISPSLVCRIINRERRVTTKLASKFGEVIGVQAKTLLAAQARWDLEKQIEKLNV